MAGKFLAKVGALVAMQLNHVKTEGLLSLQDVVAGCIDEHTDALVVLWQISRHFSHETG